MPISARTAACLLILLLSTARDVQSELVTFRFEGTVTNVMVDIPEFWGATNVDWPDIGSKFSGYYTFDSTAPDTASSAEQGAYHAVLENGTAVDVTVSDLHLQGEASFVATYASIYEAGDWIPSLELVSHPTDATIFNRNNFQLSIRKDGLLPGPILPLTPPSVAGAQNATLLLWLDNGYNTRPYPYVSIAANLDSLVLAPPIDGDFNADGTVDTADYVVWRKNDGLPEGYNTWRANFGNTVENMIPRNGPTSVPEPATWVLLSIACVYSFRHLRRAAERPRVIDGNLSSCDSID